MNTYLVKLFVDADGYQLDAHRLVESMTEKGAIQEAVESMRIDSIVEDEKNKTWHEEALIYSVCWVKKINPKDVALLEAAFDESAFD